VTISFPVGIDREAPSSPPPHPQCPRPISFTAAVAPVPLLFKGNCPLNRVSTLPVVPDPRLDPPAKKSFRRSHRRKGFVVGGGWPGSFPSKREVVVILFPPLLFSGKVLDSPVSHCIFALHGSEMASFESKPVLRVIFSSSGDSLAFVDRQQLRYRSRNL